MSDDLVPELSLETRQDERMGSLPEIYRTAHERLACELALRMDEPEAIFARYKYTPDEAIVLLESPAFTAMLTRISVEVRENGLSFRMKAKAISEELLPHAFDMATDPMTSPAVRADLIKWAAKVAGNEPKESKDETVRSGFNLSITFAGQAPQAVLTQHEPVTIEGERA